MCNSDGFTLVTRNGRNKSVKGIPVNDHDVKEINIRDIIFGSKDPSSVRLKVVPRMGCVHVYRLAPETTEKAVSDYLQQFGPCCKCEMLNSKFPEIYVLFFQNYSTIDSMRSGI